jgi:hypothetical protein
MSSPATSAAVVASAMVVIAGAVMYATVRRRLLAHFTIVGDLKLAGKPRQGGKLPRRAVICGGRYVLRRHLRIEHVLTLL